MPPDAMTNGDAATLGGYVAIATAACAAFVAGRFVEEVEPQWRVALDIVALAGAGVPHRRRARRRVARRGVRRRGRRARDDRAARRATRSPPGAARAYLGLALGYALLYLAPPEALVEGLADLPGAALALGASALAALRGAQLLGRARAGAGDETAAVLTRARATLGADRARSRCCTSPRRRSSRPSSPARACRTPASSTSAPASSASCCSARCGRSPA